jgi:hypothetical protein
MRTYKIEAKTRKEKFKKLSLEDEYRVRFLKGLPTKRIERRLLRRLRDKSIRRGRVVR